MGSTLRLRLSATGTADDVRRQCAGLRQQLSTGTVTAVVCHVEGVTADLRVVDAVARLALVARRAGVAFTLDGPGRELSALLGLVGLRAALARVPDDP